MDRDSREVRVRTNSEVLGLTARVAHHNEFVTMMRPAVCRPPQDEFVLDVPGRRGCFDPGFEMLVNLTKRITRTPLQHIQSYDFSSFGPVVQCHET